MLRGVNKNIIEVMATDNEYFEKAILFVKPTHREKETSFLNVKAKEYVSAVSYEPKSSAVKTKNTVNITTMVKLGSAAAAGAAIASAVMILF